MCAGTSELATGQRPRCVMNGTDSLGMSLLRKVLVPVRVAQPALQAFHTSATSYTTAEPTTHYRITLRRSAIGLPSRTGRIIEALGLHKRLQSVYHAQTPTIAGMVLAVKELVHVENVRAIGTPHGAKDIEDAFQECMWVNEKGHIVDAGRVARKAPRGFKVVGNLVDEERDTLLRAMHE